MVLDGEGVMIGGDETFTAVVVQVNVRDGDIGGQGAGVYGETMIVAGDLHSVVVGELHGLVATAMPEFEFVGVRPQGQGQDLMPQADAEDGFLPQ